MANIDKHSCESCGGQLRFDPTTRALTCVSCQATSEAESAAEVVSPTCPNCNGVLPDTSGLKQVKCEYCGHTFSVLHDEENCPHIGIIPEDHKFVIPFPYDEAACKEGLIHWFAQCTKGAPGDLFEEMAFIRAPEGCYIPHYVCIASYAASYTASIGYNRTETYITYEQQTDSDGNTRTVPVTQTRIVIDWFPHSGKVAGRASNACSATSHLSDMYDKIDLANGSEHTLGNNEHVNAHLGNEIPLNPTDGKPIAEAFDTKYTAGFDVLPYTIPAEEAYDKDVIHTHISNTITQSAPGDHIRDITLSQCNIIPDYYLVYCPTWRSVYSYEDRVFATHSVGPENSSHFASYPQDSKLKKKTRLALLPFKIMLLPTLVAWIAFFVSEFFVLGTIETSDLLLNIGLVLLGVTAFVGIIGGIVRSVLYRKRQGSLIQAATSYLENPSKLFGRKSGKADPLK